PSGLCDLALQLLRDGRPVARPRRRAPGAGRAPGTRDRRAGQLQRRPGPCAGGPTMTLELIPVARPRAYPPRVSAFTQPFWNGLRAGQWQTTCCEACGKYTFPPKPVCPHCWSERMAWKDLGARGTLYSWTRIHSAP